MIYNWYVGGTVMLHQVSNIEENGKIKVIYDQEPCNQNLIVVVLGFYVPPMVEVLRRRDLGLECHPKDCQNLVYLRNQKG